MGSNTYALGRTRVIQDDSPTLGGAIGDLANTLRGNAAVRQDEEQRAKAEKRAALANAMQGLSYDQKRKVIEANPGYADVMLPDVPEGADDVKEREIKRILVTDDALLKPHERQIKMHAYGVSLGEAGAKAMTSEIYNGPEAARESADISAGRKISAQAAAEEAERNRHNVVGEEQDAPLRKAQTYQATQGGRSAGELATNRAQERSAESPLNRAKVSTNIETDAGHKQNAQKYPAPSTKATAEHPAIKDINAKLRSLSNAEQVLITAKAAASRDSTKGADDRRAAIEGRLDQVVSSIGQWKEKRALVEKQIGSGGGKPAPPKPKPKAGGLIKGEDDVLALLNGGG